MTLEAPQGAEAGPGQQETPVPASTSGPRAGQGKSMGMGSVLLEREHLGYRELGQGIHPLTRTRREMLRAATDADGRGGQR